MRHNADDDAGGSSYGVEGKGEEVLADIIYQQQQRAFLQEDNAKRVEESAKNAVFGAEMGPDPPEGKS